MRGLSGMLTGAYELPVEISEGPAMSVQRLVRSLALGVVLASCVLPAMAQQPYGYGPPPSSPEYGPPPPPPPGYESPRPAYGPPGSRCDAWIPGHHHGHRLICPMRVSKPVGAPCHCFVPPPPGYPPGPAARGQVIP